MNQFQPDNMQFHDDPVQVPAQQQSSGKIVLILAAVGVLMVGGCLVLAVAGFLGIRTLAQDSKEFESVSGTDGLSQLMVPKNWNAIPSHLANPDASIQIGNLFSENYALVISERRGDIEALQWVPGEHQATLADGVNVESYSELILNMMRTSTSKMEVTDTTQVEINGLAGIRHRIAATAEGADIVYYMLILESAQYFHQVQTWTLANREAKNMPLLKKVANSFREVE